MADVELVIKIPEDTSIDLKEKHNRTEVDNAVFNGTLLPKGHGRLIDGDYLLGILLCEDYETCVWRNCSECNREKCIKRRGILDAPTIVKEDDVRKIIDKYKVGKE